MWWQSMAIGVLLFSLMAPPVQAEVKECRFVTELLLDEPLKSTIPVNQTQRYVFITARSVQFWQEDNGFMGLQRVRCLDQMGNLLRSDLIVMATENSFAPDDPGDPGDPGEPGFGLGDVCGQEGTVRAVRECLGDLGSPDDPGDDVLPDPDPDIPECFILDTIRELDPRDQVCL